MRSRNLARTRPDRDPRSADRRYWCIRALSTDIWGRSGSDLEKRGVEPHVLVIRREQEAPSGWKRQVGNGLGAPLSEVLNVEGYEELGIVTVFATPQIPAVGTGLGWMSKSVQGRGLSSNIERNAELGLWNGWLSLNVEAPTHITLDCLIIRLCHRDDLARSSLPEVPISCTRREVCSCARFGVRR